MEDNFLPRLFCELLWYCSCIAQRILFRSEKEECKMLPIASSLDLRIVAAPAVTYTSPEKEVKESYLVET